MSIERLNLILLASLMLVSAPLRGMDATVLQNALAKNLPEKAVAALARIPEPGPKLLAARSYYRSKADLDGRWSWDAAQIAAYEGSPEQIALLAEINRVAEHFAHANPGFSLFVNSKVRSLDRQISSWNSNASVTVAGETLLTALAADAAITSSKDNPELAERLESWLRAYSPKPSPNLAAPGLSPHGQMHAIDFQIMEDGVLIAPADSRKVETIWRQQNWETKLMASIRSASSAFFGPLESPDEPWHYTYKPGHAESGQATP
jgi:hypothetical protein